MLPSGGRVVSGVARMSGWRPLPARTRRHLEHGPRPGQYRGEYAAHAALVRQMFCAGWLPSEIADALRGADNDGGEFYRSRLASPRDGRRAFPKYIVRICDYQAELDEVRPRRRPEQGDVHEVTQAVRAYAAEALHGTRTYAASMAAVDAWCVIALRHGTTAPLVPARDLQLQMGAASLQTAHRALKRLVDAGILVEADRSTTARAKAYEPGAAARSRLIPVTDTSPHREGQAVTTMSLYPDGEVWRHLELGRSARLVYAALDDREPAARAEIVERSGVSRATAARVLRALQDRGLAVSADRAWTRTAVDPDGTVTTCKGHAARDRAYVEKRRCAYHAREAGAVVQVDDGRWVDGDGVVVVSPRERSNPTMTTTAAELHRMVFGDTAKRPAEDKPWVCAETITVVLGGGHRPQVRRCRNLVGATPPEACQTGQGRCARHADHDGEEGCRHHPSWQRIVAAFWHAGHHHGQ